VPLWADGERALLRQSVQPHRLDFATADPRQQRLGEEEGVR
jgi:hypothetical protein